MAIFKCKMCGGALEISEGSTVAECEYCGTKQTVPTADSEKKMSLFTRANKLRAACDFDKAAGIYESIVTEFPEEAEAYWGLILCNYGIEYVDDPATGKKIPTCHRSSFDSVLDSSDFEMVMENADAVSRKVYRDEAKAIEELRKAIIEVSSKEEPYDIFICYKETDENGDRTIDSVIAQDVYTELTGKGYRVFFSRITLEDKLGQEYEPYIFAALNSAKIMLAFGTDYEYYNAVWVKNEWSRFLQLIAKGEKKTLIPCYKNIDAYDMPREFAKLQAQDMGKVGAIQDLLRGIEKIIGGNQSAKSAEQVVVNQVVGGPNVEALLTRGNIALEDEEFEKAEEYFNQVLNMNAKCAEAYLGFAMTTEKVCTVKAFVYRNKLNNKNYQRAKQYADKTLFDMLLNLEKEAEEERIRRAKEAEEERKRRELEAEQERIRREKEAKKKKEKFDKLQKILKGILVGGGIFTAFVKSDGTVTVVGDQDYDRCFASAWYNAVAVSGGNSHMAAIKSDGKVIAAGSNLFDRCDVEHFKDIVDISVSGYHTVGLKSDGTVLAVGANEYGRCNVSSWSDIVSVSVGDYHTVGLKSDGTVLAVGANEYGRCNISSWKDIISVSVGGYHTVGLKADGSVVATGKNLYHQCDVGLWKDIVAVSAGVNYTVGLKADGTVVAVGKNDYGQCNVTSWTDIVAVSTGTNHTVGLKSDGTLVAVGNNDYGQCNVSGYKLFDDLDNIEQERKVKMSETAKIIEKRRSAGLCQHCGGTFKGLFTKKCTKCGKEKYY